VQLELKRMGFDPVNGVDRHFLDEAQQSHKPIGALEDAGSQLEFFSSLSEELQDHLLLSSLVDMEKWSDCFDLMNQAWQSGDDAAMAEIITRRARDYPQLEPLMTKLLDDRSTAMTTKIERLLQT